MFHYEIYNPTMSGPGPSTTGVIYVYTEEHNMDTIGFKLLEIVQTGYQVQN